MKKTQQECAINLNLSLAYLNNLNNAGAAEAAKRAIKANDQNPKGQPFLITKIDRN